MLLKSTSKYNNVCHAIYTDGTGDIEHVRTSMPEHQYSDIRTNYVQFDVQCWPPRFARLLEPFIKLKILCYLFVWVIVLIYIFLVEIFGVRFQYTCSNHNT